MRQVAGQGLRHQQAWGVDTWSAVHAKDVLRSLQDAVMAWPLEALQACKCIRVHPMQFASLHGSGQSDDTHTTAVSVDGSILEYPITIRASQSLDGSLPLLGSCEPELVH